MTRIPAATVRTGHGVRRKTMMLLRVPAALLVVSAGLVACREAPAPPSVTHPPETPAASPPPPAVAETRPPAITRVSAASQVCMVNDRFMGAEQIPVSVAGKTYYGCCASCKAKLESSTSARMAVDPVTKKPVDKASAVIGATASGKVFYFESAETLARYTPDA